MTSAKGPTYWQRRYLLRHYRRFDDTSLACATGLSASRVAGFLQPRRAVRSPGDCRRIARETEAPPAVFTPAFALRRVAQLRSRPLTQLDGVVLALMLVGSVVLYALTAARTVTGEDAGELLAAAHGLGVPHPPGYPLWLLLAWAADHGLPFGTVAWRVSQVSVVFSALANAILLAVALKTVRSRLAAFAGAALFAVSLTHWRQAVIPEVYGLNTFFVALTGLLLVRLAERPTAARLLWLAALTGLSATNHTTAVPVGAVALLGALVAAPALFRRPVVVLGALFAGLLPLLLYLVLPWASLRDPYIDWGNPEDATALWEHVTRKQYAAVEAEQQANRAYDAYLGRLGVLGQGALWQFGGPWVLLLSLLGFFVLLFRQTGAWLYWMVVAYLCSVGVVRYTAFSFDREHLYAVQIFWIPAWMTLAWFAAGGLDVVLAGLRRLLGTRRALAAPCLSIAACVLVLVPGLLHHELADRSGTTLVRDYGRALLDTMERNALYFPSSDHSTFAALYWQGVEGHRLDVTIADKFGRLDEALLAGFMDDETDALLATLPPARQRRAIEAMFIRRWPGPVYFANKRDMSDVPERVLEPVGLLFRVMTEEEAAAWWAEPEDGGEPAGLRAWDGLAALMDVEERERVDFTVQMIDGDLAYLHGFALLRAGRLDDAISVWSTVQADLAPLKQIYNNIGSALAENGRPTEAVAFYEKAIAEDERYFLAVGNKAVVHKVHGQRGAAIGALLRLLELDPTQRQARIDVARLLGEADRVVEALAQYEAMAKHDRKDIHPWREAGRLLQRIGDRKKAERAYLEALRLDPHQNDVREWLAEVRQGVDLLAADVWGMPGVETDVHAHPDLSPAPEARWTMPGLPPEPAEALRFDPMARTRPPEPASRP
jgi:tetratricopeptide (TPR) repeat protein